MGCAKKRSPMLVGLCGRSGSGKGYVSEMFYARGIPSIDTDAVYRKLTAPSDELSPCMAELVGRFGTAVACEDNSLNRAVMRSLVFGEDKKALADLDRISHRHILAETERMAKELKKNGSDIVLIDAPLLFESGFDKKCAKIIAVTASETTVVRRIMRRDGISEDAARARLKTQIPAEELASRADYVIVNDGDDEAMIKVIDECVASLRVEAEKTKNHRRNREKTK